MNAHRDSDAMAEVPPQEQGGRTLRIDRRPTVRAEDLPQARWFLRVAFSPDRALQGAAFSLLGRVALAGRSVEGSADLRLDDPMVSRQHALFELGDVGLSVRDLGSANGVLVNGHAVPQTGLRRGDVVRLGDTVLLVLDRPPAPVPLLADNLGLVGRTPAMARLRETIERVAPSSLSVLITGPTGTGKEVVARAMHACSGRTGPFVAVNCPALPGTLVESSLFGHKKGAFTHATADQDGAFVQAHGGTLFLDEIGDMPAGLQPKLLRALDDGSVTPLGASRSRQVDARVVVATNVDLNQAMAEGRFRDDLYGRLSGVRLSLPALKERRDDVPLLFRHYLPAPLRDVPMTPDFAEALLLYDWPRNVRELVKLSERLGVLHPDARSWQLEMLDDDMRPDAALSPPAPPIFAATPQVAPPAPPRAAAAVTGRRPPPSREELRALLDRFGGNVTDLAEHVGRSRKQVYRWMADHGLSRGTGRE